VIIKLFLCGRSRILRVKSEEGKGKKEKGE